MLNITLCTFTHYTIIMTQLISLLINYKNASTSITQDSVHADWPKLVPKQHSLHALNLSKSSRFRGHLPVGMACAKLPRWHMARRGTLQTDSQLRWAPLQREEVCHLCLELSCIHSSLSLSTEQPDSGYFLPKACKRFKLRSHCARLWNSMAWYRHNKQLGV